MKVVNKKVEELIPYVNNPRNNEDAIDAVASSIKNFGFKVPIVIDSKNEIINGHTRVKAAKKLGLKEVPAVIADDLTEEQIKAFRIADNKVSELAEWNDELLAIELEELSNLDFDMTGLGFTQAELDSINLQDFSFDGTPELSDDSYEEPEKKLYRCPNCGHVDSSERFVSTDE